MATNKEIISQTLSESSQVLAELSRNTGDIEKISTALIAAYKKGNKMVLFGNGGSAADAQHIATELVGGFTNHSRPSLPALALTTDTSALTAIGNDYSFEEVFSRQVEGLVNVGDVAIGISTSGNSKNVIRAIQSAKKRGAVTVGFTGASGGALKKECDFCLCVPSSTRRTTGSHFRSAYSLRLGSTFVAGERALQVDSKDCHAA